MRLAAGPRALPGPLPKGLSRGGLRLRAAQGGARGPRGPQQPRTEGQTELVLQEGDPMTAGRGGRRSGHALRAHGGRGLRGGAAGGALRDDWLEERGRGFGARAQGGLAGVLPGFWRARRGDCHGRSWRRLPERPGEEAAACALHGRQDQSGRGRAAAHGGAADDLRCGSGRPQCPAGPGRRPGSRGRGPAGEGAASAAPGLLGAATLTAACCLS